MKYRIILALFLSALLTACASGPSVERMEAVTKNFELESESEGDVVDLYIYYNHNDKRRMVSGDITYYLDGAEEPTASVGFRQYIHIQTTPGTHELRWQGTGKKRGLTHSDSISLTLEQGQTYIYRQVHDVIFNRYADDGLSVISSLRPAKSLLHGKYYMSQTKKRE